MTETRVNVQRAIDTDTIVGVVHIKRSDLKDASAFRVRDLVHEAVELLREALLEKLEPK